MGVGVGVAAAPLALGEPMGTSGGMSIRTTRLWASTTPSRVQCDHHELDLHDAARDLELGRGAGRRAKVSCSRLAAAGRRSRCASA
ncbi:MAG: hypothetical protein U0838_14560 [Chloroflexota bacterium]